MSMHVLDINGSYLVIIPWYEKAVDFGGTCITMRKASYLEVWNTSDSFITSEQNVPFEMRAVTYPIITNSRSPVKCQTKQNPSRTFLILVGHRL